MRFDLSAEGTGTLLVLTDELPPGIAARNAAGWEQCLARLARQESPEEPSWKVSFDKYAAEFTPLLGPQDGPPRGTRWSRDNRAAPTSRGGHERGHDVALTPFLMFTGRAEDAMRF